MPRSVRLAVGSVLSGLTWLAAMGCSSGHTTTAAATPAATSAAATPSATASPAATTHSADLKTYLLPPPAGAQPASSFPAVRGAFAVPAEANLTQAQAASLSINPNGNKLLAEHHLVRAAATAWTTGDGTAVLVELLQFPAVSSAASYFTAERDTVRNQFSPNFRYAVDAIPDAGTYVVHSADAHGTRRSYSYANRGDVVIFVITAANVATVNVDAANAVLTQQYNRL
jgi:hypothetical protein